MARAIHLIEGASFYSVKNYGATGDNSTNDTAAFHAAITAMPSGSVLWVPPGNYRVKQLALSKSMLMMGGGTLRNYDTSDNTNSSNYIANITASGVGVRGINIIGSVSSTATAPATWSCLSIANGLSYIVVEDCFIQGGRRNIDLSTSTNHWFHNNTLIDAWDYSILGPVSCDRAFFLSNIIANTRNNAGIRIGSLTGADACNDLVIADNQFYNVGYSTPQDAIDISTAVATRIVVHGNIIKDCGNAIELKVDTDHTGYTDARISDNIITASSSSYNARIAVTFSTATGDQDHLQRVDVSGNQIYVADPASTAGVRWSSHNDIIVRDNFIVGSTLPLRMDCTDTGLTAKRHVITGNRTYGGYGLYIEGDSGTVIEDAVIADNVFTCSNSGIYCVESGGVGASFTNPEVVGNIIRSTSTTLPAMQFSGFDTGTIAHNSIKSADKGIVFSGSQANANTTIICQNTINSAEDAIQINTASGTFEVFENTTRAATGRGVLDSAAGATTLAGGNCRGVSSAAPTTAGGLGDFYYDSSPAAGATKWVCTTAGGAGVAVWTAQ